MFVMISVMIFILFFTGTKSTSNTSKETVKNVIETPPIQPETSQNLYTQNADSKDKTLDKISNNTINLKPPAPPAPPVVLKEKNSNSSTTLPPAPTPVQQTKVQEPQLPIICLLYTSPSPRD